MRIGNRVRDDRGEWGTIIHPGDVGCIVSYGDGRPVRWVPTCAITLHPDGLAHGPQPGRTEASIGQKATNELAVMVDTFRSLHVSREATEIEDEGYYLSWLDS